MSLAASFLQAAQTKQMLGEGPSCKRYGTKHLYKVRVQPLCHLNLASAILYASSVVQRLVYTMAAAIQKGRVTCGRLHSGTCIAICSGIQGTSTCCDHAMPK